MKNIGVILLLIVFSTVSSCNKSDKEKATDTNTSIPKENTTIKSNPKISKNSLGKRLFILCASCHNVNKGEPHKVGPNLHGFFGQKAGMKEGFAYSEELKNKEITWNEETIREWLQNPATYVPGTKMAFVGVKKKEQQDALIAYLKEITKE